jgi:hypothetical protein
VGYSGMSVLNASIKEKMKHMKRLKEGSRSFIEKTRSINQEMYEDQS